MIGFFKKRTLFPAISLLALAVVPPAEPVDLTELSLEDLANVRALRNSHPLKGIALSGLGTEADISASKAAGFAEHLIKPVTVEELEAVIRRVLGEATVESAMHEPAYR